MRKDPLASLNQLGKELDLAPNTVRARISYLKDNNIVLEAIEKDDVVLGKRLTSEVVAHQSPEKLGMQRVNVLFTQLPDYETYEKIVKILDAHPYTVFRILGLDFSINIYVQFDLPIGSFNQFNKFIDKMKALGIYNNMTVMDPSYGISTLDDLTKWNNKDNTWNFNILGDDPISFRNLFLKYLAEKKYLSVKTNVKKMEVGVKVEKHKKTDLLILRELTLNGKLKIKDIADHYQRDPTTLSRRVSKVKEMYVNRFNLRYDRSFFGLNSVIMIWGEMEEKHILTLFKMIEDDQFPFFSHFSVDSQFNFMWYLHCPTKVISDLSLFLLPYSTSMHLMVLNTNTSKRYYFFPNNYDFDKSEWKISKEYMVDGPLEGFLP